MEYSKNLIQICVLALLLGSCGGDDAADCTAASFNSEINATIDVLNTAAQTWANDPTSANCDAYKDAANDYLDAVENLEGCAGISASDYDQAVDAARAAVASIPCS